ncbi:hypothetical protein BQ8794_300014 [Mesorhizobium prunaredense]|uniref:Uncharacterized protein n=1 Tax=Mesorhizobium prunaredense TaxID=1631249 RepID=A0A1R3VB39_9HYPH|nr:hypothetical protein BQ8794_300014 [Mesorhizobium prunaredense]
MLLLQPRIFEADISLFLFGHYLPSARLRRPKMGLIGRGRRYLAPARSQYHISYCRGMLPRSIRHRCPIVAHCHYAVTEANLRWGAP